MRRRNSRSAHLRRLRRRHLPEMRYPAGSRGRPGHGVIICLLLAVHVVIPCDARMTTPALVAPSEAKSTWLDLISAFALHTLIVYMLALHVSPILAGRWFAWVLPALQFHASGSPLGWYLQHLELATMVPALIAGYLNVARFIPTIVSGQVKDAQHEPAAAWV